MSKKIIFFDVDCIQCNKFITIVNKYSKVDDLYFASFKSKAFDVIRKMPEYDASKETIYFIKDKKVLIKSKAVFTIFRHLKFPFRILSVLRFSPIIISDIGYDYFAKRRMKSSQCSLEFFNSTLTEKILP